MYYFIEPMTEDDIERVQVIERQSFVTPWSTNTYRNELRNISTSRYIVARASSTPPPPRQNTPTRRRRWLATMLPSVFQAERAPASPYPIIGYGGLWLNVDEGHVTTIAVAPEYRGRGIGELLLNGLIDQAMQLNADMLTLEVRITNVVAQQLYQKYGFRVVGSRPRYYTDNGEDALIMSTDPIRSSESQQRFQQLREQLFERLRLEAAEPPKAPAPTPPPVPSRRTAEQ